MMEALEKHGLVINGEKCQFHKSQVEFLGHLASKSDIRLLPAKVEAITKYQVRQAHYVLPAAQLPGDDQLIQEVPSGGQPASSSS